IDIVEKQTIAPDERKINHFYEHDGRLYISTDYGISVYDLENLEFGETFYIGNNGAHLNVLQTTILGDNIYAATDQGIKIADLNSPFLIDYGAWETLAAGSWVGIVSFQNNIYAAKAENSLNKLQGNSFQTIQVYNSPIVDLRASDKILS